jgi:membrane protease YdiL (CAAX protease family)
MKEKSDLFVLAASIVAIATLTYYDPFSTNRRILDFLRLNFAIFTKEPRLLIYASIYIGSFIAKAVALFIIMTLLAFRRIKIVENLGITMPKSGKWAGYILPFAVLSIGIRTYYSLNPLIPNLPVRMVFPESMATGNIMVLFSILCVAPIMEELIFRGYVFDVLKRSFGVYSSVLLSSILFAAAHIAQNNFEPLNIAIIFILGVIFGIARDKTDSVLAPMAFHGIYNLISVVMGIFYYFVLGY